MYVSDKSEPGSKLPISLRAPFVPSALRLLFVAVILCTEIVGLSVWLEPHWGSAYIQEADPDSFAVFNIWESHSISLLISFVSCFAIVGYAKRRTELVSFANAATKRPLRWPYIVGHLLSVLAYISCSFLTFDRVVSGAAFNVVGISKIFAGFSAIACLCLAAIPLNIWRTLIQNTGLLWLFSVGATIMSALVGHWTRSLWQSSEGVAFELANITLVLVERLLHLFTSNVVMDPSAMVIGTERFAAKIGDACSGFQGIGLMVAFGSIWLYLFRRELVFPRTLLLLPVGIVLIFLLNALRITALILLGSAGAEEIATSGFHSKAGWISFNVMALTFSMIFCRLPWFQVRGSAKVQNAKVRTVNPTAAYLLPMVAILATGMLAGAASAGFEWLYPLRFFAALAALWWFRKVYLALDWSFGWPGPATGVLVFLIWIGLSDIHTSMAMPDDLSFASARARLTWITFRILAATLTVPIAEELAFRGFLIRRFISQDFELLSFRRFTAVGLAVSSVAFGLMHGRQWFAGIVAGLLYALVMIKRGKIGEAVAAHATTNALLAGYVLAYQKWNLW